MANDLFEGQGFDKDSYRPPAPGNFGGDKDYYAFRWYIKKNMEKSIITLTDINGGKTLVEHGAWDPVRQRAHHFPCLSALKRPCWLCDQRAPRSRLLFLQVIDRDGYISKKGPNAGKPVHNVKTLLGLIERKEGNEIDLFIRRDNQNKGLKFCEFKVYKSSARLGEEWTLTRKWTPEDFLKENIDSSLIPWNKIFPADQTADYQKQFFAENPTVTWEQKELKVEAPAQAEEPTVYPDTSSASPSPTSAPSSLSRAGVTDTDEIPF